MSQLAPTLQAFFTDRLITQRDASPRTVAAYRDTFRLLLSFAQRQTGKQPCELDLSDLDAPLIGAFLTHLEHDRGNSPRTRNARLAAIHSFCRYAALRHPEHAATIARVIEIPSKRYERNNVSYLTKPEIDALLAAPDQTTWLGRRDHALLLTAITTGLRVSELVALRIANVTLNIAAHLRVHGKGRKERTTPLKAETVAVLREWLHERQGEPEDPVFPTRRQGRPLSHDAVSKLLAKHIAQATTPMPVACDQTRQPPRPPAHQRDAPPSRTSRHRDDRPVARPREHQDHLHLPARRQRPQTTSHRPHRPDRHPTRQIPAPRHAPRVPRVANDYADQPTTPTSLYAGKTRITNSQVGITRNAA
jgi:site-specific recombinase XerD